MIMDTYLILPYTDLIQRALRTLHDAYNWTMTNMSQHGHKNICVDGTNIDTVTRLA